MEKKGNIKTIKEKQYYVKLKARKMGNRGAKKKEKTRRREKSG